MMTLWLSNEEVEELLSMREYVDLVEEAHREVGAQLACERIISRTHTYLGQPGHDQAYLFKSIEGGSTISKTYAVRLSSDIVIHRIVDGVKRRSKLPLAGGRYTGLLLIFNSDTGELAGILQDGYLNRMLTGATGGVGTKYIARQDSEIIGLLGSGWQAGGQIMSLACVYKIRKVRVYSPTSEHRESFARDFGRLLGIDIEAVKKPEEALQKADIIVVATNAVEPVLFGRWLNSGVHFTSIVSGDAHDQRREVDDESIQKSEVIMITAKQQAYVDHQADIYGPIVERRLFPWDKVLDMTEVISSGENTRGNKEQITFFKHNTVLGSSYAVAGASLLRSARERGWGKELDPDLFSQNLVP